MTSSKVVASGAGHTPGSELRDIAKAIVNGSLRPWQFQSDIASPTEWVFYAQCALDGDDADLRLLWTEFEADREGYRLPDNEDWREDYRSAAETTFIPQGVCHVRAA